jgi:hypothetical protein
MLNSNLFLYIHQFVKCYFLLQLLRNLNHLFYIAGQENMTNIRREELVTWKELPNPAPEQLKLTTDLCVIRKTKRCLLKVKNKFWHQKCISDFRKKFIFWQAKSFWPEWWWRFISNLNKAVKVYNPHWTCMFCTRNIYTRKWQVNIHTLQMLCIKWKCR